MISQMSPIYQLICALLVTLCVDRVFRNFAWSKGTFSNILNTTRNAYQDGKQIKSDLNSILKDKYNDYFEQAKYHSFIYLAAFSVLLYISSCQLENNNPHLIYGLAIWIIAYCLLITILFILFRDRLFNRLYKFFLLIALFLVIVALHGYCYKYNCYLLKELLWNISSITRKHYIALATAVLGFIPFCYFFLHCRLFDKVYACYLKSLYKTNSIYWDYKNATAIEKSITINSITLTNQNLDIKRVYNTLRKRNLVGISLMTIGLWLFLSIKLFILLYNKVSDLIVGFFTHLVLLGRKKKRLIKRKFQSKRRN